MRIIITALLIVLVFSGYMALNSDFNFKPAHAENQPVFEVHFEELKSPEPAKVLPPTPAPEETAPEEIEGCKDTTEQDEIYSYNNTPEEEIMSVFGVESKIAMAIAKAESGLNPEAVNRNRDGSRDIGIFQINDRHGWNDEELFDWKQNIRIAKELRDRHGWSQWAAYNNGSYRNFL